MKNLLMVIILWIDDSTRIEAGKPKEWISNRSTTLLVLPHSEKQLTWGPPVGLNWWIDGYAAASRRYK